MKDFLVQKEKHYLDYADAVYKDFLQTRFGLKTCRPSLDQDLAYIRKSLTDWQQNEDNGALTQTSVSYITWMGVNYDLDEIESSDTGIGYLQSPTPVAPQNLGLNYNYGTNLNQNVVEVNAGGCLTRINLNPSIQINQNSKFVFNQTIASNLWTINHNLGFVPNVFTQDTTGKDIEGLVEPINDHTLTISFSQPVAGTAYLS